LQFCFLYFFILQIPEKQEIKKTIKSFGREKMNFGQFLTIFISAVFVNNAILSRFLGLCPFVAMSKDIKQAFVGFSGFKF
jgi:Na+-translocating ferredoxin:NAD+ oxidoreductase RnfE subunit